jgi:hypothetical protein
MVKMLVTFQDLVNDLSTFDVVNNMEHVVSVPCCPNNELEKYMCIKTLYKKGNICVTFQDKHTIHYTTSDVAYDKTYAYIIVKQVHFDTHLMMIYVYCRLKYGEQLDRLVKYFFGSYGIEHKFEKNNNNVEFKDIEHMILTGELQEDAKHSILHVIHAFDEYLLTISPSSHE